MVPKVLMNYYKFNLNGIKIDLEGTM